MGMGEPPQVEWFESGERPHLVEIYRQRVYQRASQLHSKVAPPSGDTVSIVLVGEIQPACKCGHAIDDQQFAVIAETKAKQPHWVKPTQLSAAPFELTPIATRQSVRTKRIEQQLHVHAPLAGGDQRDATSIDNGTRFANITLQRQAFLCRIDVLQHRLKGLASSDEPSKFVVGRRYRWD